MTPEEIIEMARQAGIHYREIPGEFATGNGDGVENEQMEEFAKLVAAKEREACVKAYEAEADTWKAWPQAGIAKRKGVAAIRARGES